MSPEQLRRAKRELNTIVDVERNLAAARDELRSRIAGLMAETALPDADPESQRELLALRSEFKAVFGDWQHAYGKIMQLRGSIARRSGAPASEPQRRSRRSCLA